MLKCQVHKGVRSENEDGRRRLQAWVKKRGGHGLELGKISGRFNLDSP